MQKFWNTGGQYIKPHCNEIRRLEDDTGLCKVRHSIVSTSAWCMLILVGALVAQYVMYNSLVSPRLYMRFAYSINRSAVCFRLYLLLVLCEPLSYSLK